LRSLLSYLSMQWRAPTCCRSSEGFPFLCAAFSPCLSLEGRSPPFHVFFCSRDREVLSGCFKRKRPHFPFPVLRSSFSPFPWVEGTMGLPTRVIPSVEFVALRALEFSWKISFRSIPIFSSLGFVLFQVFRDDLFLISCSH